MIGETQAVNSDTVMLDKPTVLIVDDDAAICKLLMRMLGHNGYETKKANSVDEALVVLANVHISLIITDVMMPGKTGFDLLEEVKAAWPSIPLVIMTGQPSLEAAVDCIKNGARDYLQKPLNMGKLLAVCDKFINGPPQEDQIETVAAEPAPKKEGHGQGNTLAGYRILKTLGQGTMGMVFLVEKEKDEGGDKFALKMFRPQMSNPMNREKATIRFRQEAEMAASIKHPYIVAVEEYGTFGYDEVPYFVMEYFTGRTLREVMDQDQLDYNQKTHIVQQVSAALEEIHKHNILHRDIKPQNILIDGDLHTKLTDFGVARMPDSELTMGNEVLGSPAYLSPEAFITPDLDHRSDIFSLGIVAYELLLGRRPFHGDSFSELGKVMNTVHPTAPQKIREDFPVALQDVLAKMLKKRPEHRYQNAGEIVSDLDSFMKKGVVRSTKSFWKKMTTFSFSRDDWS